MAASTDKIEDCEVCRTNKAKYTCPKCEVRTCSLTCVNIHKKELDCDGIRDKTKYVPLKSFTDLDVLSDYRLLEDVGRSVDKFKRDPVKRFTRQCNLPVHLHKLKAAAFKRGVDLQFMPQNFSRHKCNTTFLKWKTNELYWRIEWIFPQANNTKWVTERVLETKRLSGVLEEILDPVKSLEDRNDIEELNLRMALHDRLQFYQAAGLTGIKVLLKAEKVLKSDSKFYELDITETLKENLENKTVIEFPTIYVVLKHHSDMYEIVNSDVEDMDDSVPKADNGNMQRKKKQIQNKFDRQKRNNAAVNYFFNTELSESEDEKMNNEEEPRKRFSDFNIPDYGDLVKMEH